MIKQNVFPEYFKTILGQIGPLQPFEAQVTTAPHYKMKVVSGSGISIKNGWE